MNYISPSTRDSFGGSSNRFDSGSSKDAPVDVGKEYDVKIEDISKKGDGIARVSGFVIFVPNTKINDEVRIEIKTVKNNFAVGEVTGAD